MAEKNGWCKYLPLVDYREKWKHYCVFHAPQGKKGIPVKDFNELIFKRIKETNENELCDLSGTIFEGDISFQFNKVPKISFKEATFNGMTDFAGVHFSKGVSFNRVNFKGKTHFLGAQFSGKINFVKTTFFEEINFNKVTFSKTPYFTRATFNRDVNFIWSEFSSGVYFFRATFCAETYFRGMTFKKEGSIVFLNIKEGIKLEGVNLEKVSFIGTDLRKIDFINCKWPKEKNGRHILYDEIKIFRNKNGKDISNKIEKVEILYRQLKQKYKAEHNEFKVSNWHYGEKEMQRKRSTWKGFSFYLLHLYRLSSGYGERPVRAGIVLFLLIIVISAFLGLTGIKSIDDNSIIEIKKWSDILNMDYLKATIEYATFESKPIFIPENWFLKIAAKLLIPLQAALFALALRNRFRR